MANRPKNSINLKQTENRSLNRRQFCSMSCAALAALHAGKVFAVSGSQESSPLPLSPRNDTFVLQVPIGNPFYAWPRTLLSYPIETGHHISPDSHTLQCVETRAVVPFQVSKSAVAGVGSAPPDSLLFFSDLPAGAKRTYRLAQQPSTPAAGQKPVTIGVEERRLTIDTGAIQIRIPASQQLQGDAPGPILEVARGGNWIGHSKLALPGYHFTRIETEQLEGGPLRSAHRITYIVDSTARYVVTVECIAGMDFVRLHEDMEAMPADALGAFDFAWTGCAFSHRQGPNHPFNFPRRPMPEYAQYPWEKIAPAQMDTQFGVSPGISPTGKMPFSLRLFEPWSDALAESFANFWGDDSQDAAAIFIDRLEQWDDHEYAIWHSSSRLAVDFVYAQSTLHFVFKIARGTRSSCLSFYDHGKDVEAMKSIERAARGVESDGAVYRTSLFPASHALELQNWHGTLNLDKVKDWTLDSVRAALPKPVFTNAPYKNAEEFYLSVIRSAFLSDLALSGVRQNNGFGPTSSRQILESWVPAYQIFRSQLNPEQRRRMDAIFLLIGYVHAGEDYMPMQHMLAGHPNFLSDVKSTPGSIAFLFPEHPAAETWADQFEAFLRLNTRYHTRPAVHAWGARGGRWTENLGTYVWAFLRPASRAAFLLRCRDGHERLCGPQVAQIGDWLVNALSAPFAGESPATMKRIEEESARSEGARRHYWGIVAPAAGPRRLHLPVGAHSERRKTPRTMWYLGAALRNSSPLTAEHLMWAARPTDQDMEATADQGDPYGAMYPQADNHGTNPHLQSAKYTGYGITLRAAVDTPRELSIHLLQIDDGPNYRWGVAAEGSCGVVYFYANGKAYSHNGGEDVGDRIDQDTDFCTNFGVWKDGAFRSIGQNVLSSPLYDLSVAQFAQLVPRQGQGPDSWPEYPVVVPRERPGAYSWPEYVSRNVLLAGDDYFILYDRVFNPQVAHRFSWFVRKGDDFPHIALLSGNPREEASLFTSVETDTTSGRWSEGVGDSLAFITHKSDIRAERAPFGARISHAEGTDLVFLAPATLRFQEGKKAFTGTSGIIRDRKDGTEIALFHGTHIAASGIGFTTTDTDLGISATISNDGSMRGCYFAPSASDIEIGLPPHPESLQLYIDGARVSGDRSAAAFTVKLPAGTHQWELTSVQPVPLPPSIDRTEYTKGGAIVYATQAASASSYTLQLSTDNSKTWTENSTASNPVFTLTGLTPGEKYHARILARNAAHSSAPGPEYPLYITREPPSPPEGLRVELFAGRAEIDWGEVLGVAEYRLYRKSADKPDFALAYTGRSTHWTDADPAIAPSAVSPSDTPPAEKNSSFACEYYVTTVNHIGESRPSRKANTNPASWRNWDPVSGESFRRTSQRTEGNPPNDNGDRYYPPQH
jgi:hypothetical protein